MVFLPGLAVVFVGIVGNGAGKIDHQVKGLLADEHVQAVGIPAASVAILAHHGEGCGDLVRRLHVDGVVGGELVTSRGHQTLRLAIYVGDGSLKSLAEIPLSGLTLTHDELDVLRSNLDDDVVALEKAAPKEPSSAATPPAVAVKAMAPAPVAVKVPPPVAPAPVAVKAPHPVAPAPVAVKAPPPVAPAPVAVIALPPAIAASAAVVIKAPTPVAAKSSAMGMDDENPFATTAVAPAARKVAPTPKRDSDSGLVPRTAVAPASPASAAPSGELAFADDKIYRETPPKNHPATAVQTADASASVTTDDIEAMMKGGGESGVMAGGGDVPTVSSAPELRLHGAIGFGLASRSFSPGPATVPGYTSSPVGSIRFDAGVEPTPRIALAISGERTLQMATPKANEMAVTTMSRWEAVAGYSVVRGRVDLAPILGLGHRSFSIDSTDPARSPDGDYKYLILGAKASMPLGHRLTVRGVAAFEPVVSGSEPTEMAFGEASRWAFDVGAAIEARPLPFVFVRAAADYQSFTWSWDLAGTRGAGGAVDTYPSGTLSLGAEY